MRLLLAFWQTVDKRSLARALITIGLSMFTGSAITAWILRSALLVLILCGQGCATRAAFTLAENATESNTHVECSSYRLGLPCGGYKRAQVLAAD